MADGPLNSLVSQLVRAARPPQDEGVDDGGLLRRYADEADQAAFELLLHRHGPMVWGVCRRILAPSDADDAFQATFLVLVRKAGSVVKQSSIAAWLHGVAQRVALRARSSERGRKAKEGLHVPPKHSEPPDPGLREVLDEELSRLPEKYRAPLVLCYLEGKTNDEAAALLGWTRGTLAGRMSRARELLRHRLERRGLTLPSALPHVAVPAALVSSTLKAVTAGVSLAGPAVLADGVIRSMLFKKLTLAGLALAATLTGAGLVVLLARTGPPATPRPADPPAAKAPSRADLAAAVKGNTAFALDLYHKLRAEKGNVFFSPFSISSALAMTHAGAAGDTADEMARALHFTLPRDRLHPAMGGLVTDLHSGGKKRGVQVSIANSLWGQKGYPFQPAFLALNKANYSAGMNEADFAKDTEGARKAINAWVEKHTSGIIKELVRPRVLHADTRLALVNAIHFKGTWKSKFDRKDTKEADFHLDAKTKVKVPLMYQKGTFGLLMSDEFNGVELPYGNGDTSMILLVPDEVTGLPALEKELTPANLKTWLEAMMPVPFTEVHLPRFKLEWAAQLNEPLEALGMRKAFDPKKADFSALDGGKGFCVGPVVHKAAVEVNEEGTEAAAGTVVGGLGGGPPVIRADRPFLFLIRHTRSGSILFIGRVVDPRR